MSRSRAALLILAAGLAVSARAEQPLPPQLEGVGVTEQLGHKVDLNLTFVDESARVVKLGDFFHSGRPVILDLVYYSCPMLCTLVLNGQAAAVGKLPWTPGQEYEIVTISIDPTETPELARQKKAAYVEQLGRGGAGWHFLTDLDGHVKQLAQQVGWHYKYDDKIRQYAHQAAIMILAPDGEVSRYLYGIEFEPRDLRLSLTEASKGKFTLSLDRLLLFCYHYDPEARSYVLFATNLMRWAGVLIVSVMAFVLWRLWRRERMAGI